MTRWRILRQTAPLGRRGLYRPAGGPCGGRGARDIHQSFSQAFGALRGLCARPEVLQQARAHAVSSTKSSPRAKVIFAVSLCPPSLLRYYSEEINITDKDGRLALANNFLINLDELKIYGGRDINGLKSFLSKERIKGAAALCLQARGVHPPGQLRGQHERRGFPDRPHRQQPMVVLQNQGVQARIQQDHRHRPRLGAGLLPLESQGAEHYKLSAKEILQNEQQANKFKRKSAEVELVSKYFRPGQPKDPDTQFLTATEIMVELNRLTDKSVRLSPRHWLCPF